MLTLRYPGRWRIFSIVLLVAVLGAALSPVFWHVDERRALLSWLLHADKWMHGLVFFALTSWFTGLYAVRAYWRVAVGLMAFGVLIEGCQWLVGYRMADWIDVGANSIGIIVGLGIALAGLGGWGPRLEDWYARRHAP